MDETAVAGTGGTAPGPAPGALLEVEGLTIDLAAEGSGRKPGPGGWVRVVDDLSLEVRAGETVGLVGESGSGKSMTSLGIMGLLPRRSRVAAGRVTLAGVDLVGASNRQLADRRGRDLAMVFQEPMTSLNPSFTIGRQIGETVRRHLGLSRAEAKRRAVELLDLVGIPQPDRVARDHPHQLSGGMRQRAMIAMAVSCEPMLLIADEPTTALDVTIQAQVLELLREMQERMGMAILFITHDLGVVAEICDRVAVMYAGQVVERGTTVEVFTAPQHPYSAGLLASRPEVDEAHQDLVPIPGSPPAPGSYPTGCRFHPRCPFAVDACRQAPVPEQVELTERIEGHRTVRCIRADELVLRGAR